MFTGIIEEIGKIKDIKLLKNNKIFTISAKKILNGKKKGGSISVNGSCMTIIELKKDNFCFEALQETLNKTNLGKLKKGSEVNLESPLSLQKPLDGHFVLGHIDCTSKVKTLSKKSKDKILKIESPENIKKYLALKGSITINGVSLTISHLEEDYFQANLINHTLKSTNLGNLRKNDLVNLEIDVLARYLKRLLDYKENETTYEFLKDRNFI